MVLEDFFAAFSQLSKRERLGNEGVLPVFNVAPTRARVHRMAMVVAAINNNKKCHVMWNNYTRGRRPSFVLAREGLPHAGWPHPNLQEQQRHLMHSVVLGLLVIAWEFNESGDGHRRGRCFCFAVKRESKCGGQFVENCYCWLGLEVDLGFAGGKYGCITLT